jgi:hypothetical protein
MKLYSYNDTPFLDKGYYAGLYIKMGSVLYPYTTDNPHRRGLAANQPTSWGGVFVSNTVAVVEVPLGSVAFTPSREELILNDKTNNYLAQEISSIVEDFAEAIKSDMIDAANQRTRILRLAKWDKILHSRWLSTCVDKLNQSHPELHIPTSWDSLPLFDPPESLAYLGSRGFEKDYYGTKVHCERLQSYVSVPTDQLHRIRVVIDRNQKRTVRAYKRVKAFHKERGESSYQHTTYYLKNPSNKDLERIVRAWDLKPDQLVSMGSLPDVGKPEARAKDDDSVVGVWKPDWSYYLKMSEIKPGYLWIPVAESRQGCHLTLEGLEHNFERFRFRDPNYNYLNNFVRFINNLGGENKEVLVLTPMAVKKLNPSEDDLFGKYAYKVLEKWKDDFIRLINYERPAEPLHSHGIVAEILELHKEKPQVDPRVTNAPDWLRNIFIQSFKPEPKKRGDSQLVAHKYPLLFTRKPSREQIQEYVDFINSKENK